jgi:anti-anti-sigma regulatory factor
MTSCAEFPGITVRVVSPGMGVRTRIVVGGELDLCARTALLWGAFLAGARDPSVVVVDLRAVTFVDVAGWRAVGAMVQVLEAGGVMVVVDDPAGRLARVDGLCGGATGPAEGAGTAGAAGAGWVGVPGRSPAGGPHCHKAA